MRRAEEEYSRQMLQHYKKTNTHQGVRGKWAREGAVGDVGFIGIGECLIMWEMVTPGRSLDFIPNAEESLLRVLCSRVLRLLL